MEIFFNMYKVKYNKLLELLRENKHINIATDDIIHIYINLETVLLKMCNPMCIQYITVNEKAKIEFIANIINLAAHYRLFFTRHKIESKIFLYMPSMNVKEHRNTINNKEYRMYTKFKFSDNAGNLALNKLIKDTIPFIKLITEYIEGVYFIESGKIENSLVPYIINDEFNDNKIHNFIITGDLYDIQYVNYDYNIIIPKGEDSYICNKYNAINYLKDIYECKGNYTFSSKFIPFIISIVGSKYRNIYNIKGIGMKTIYKTIQKAINSKLINNNIDNIHLLLNIIKPSVRETIMNNYKCVDINYQYTNLSKKDIYEITQCIKDKFDNIALIKINDKYFNEYPIMLEEVTSKPNKRNNIRF